MLIAVSGSSGLDEVEGIPGTDPTALLRAGGGRSPRHIILLAPSTSEAEAKRQAHVLVAAAPRSRVAVVTLDHHPLTLSLIGATVTRQLGVAADPGDVVGLIRRSAARSRSLVWYPRAWGVPDPRPHLGQLITSLVSTPGYFREIGPEPMLVPGRAGSPVTPTDQVYVAGDSPALLHRQLGTTVRSVQTELDRQPWTTASAVAIAVLCGADRAPSNHICPLCDARLNGVDCLFCGTVNADHAASPRSSALVPTPEKVDA